MKKIHSRSILAVLLAAAICFAGGSSCSAADKVIKLKLHHHDPLTATVARAIDAWVKRVEQNADGKVKITIFPSATLGSPKDAYDMVQNDVCDIAWGFTGFMPSVFPVSEGLTLPMLGVKNAVHGSQALMDMFENTDYMQKEYSKMHVFFVHALSAYPIATKTKEVKTLEDMKGIKLRVPGGPATAYMVNIGASPINITSPEIYTSLERRVIDGIIFDWTGMAAFKLQEQLSYILDCGATTGVSWFAMNKEKWDSFPDDVKAAFNKESGLEGVRKVAAFWDNDTNKLKETVFKGKVRTLSDEQMALWQQKADTQAQEWIKSMNEKGYDGQAIYSKYKELIAKYAK